MCITVSPLHSDCVREGYLLLGLLSNVLALLSLPPWVAWYSVLPLTYRGQKTSVKSIKNYEWIAKDLKFSFFLFFAQSIFNIFFKYDYWLTTKGSRQFMIWGSLNWIQLHFTDAAVFTLNTCRVFHLQTSCSFVQPLQQMTESALQMWDTALTISDNTPETTNNINLSCDRNRSM